MKIIICLSLFCLLIQEFQSLPLPQEEEVVESETPKQSDSDKNAITVVTSENSDNSGAPATATKTTPFSYQYSIVHPQQQFIPTTTYYHHIPGQNIQIPLGYYNTQHPLFFRPYYQPVVLLNPSQHQQTTWVIQHPHTGIVSPAQPPAVEVPSSETTIAPPATEIIPPPPQDSGENQNPPETADKEKTLLDEDDDTVAVDTVSKDFDEEGLKPDTKSNDEIEEPKNDDESGLSLDAAGLAELEEGQDIANCDQEKE